MPAGAMYIVRQTLNAHDYGYSAAAAGGVIAKISVNPFPTWDLIRCFFDDLEVKIQEEQ